MIHQEHCNQKYVEFQIFTNRTQTPSKRFLTHSLQKVEMTKLQVTNDIDIQTLKLSQTRRFQVKEYQS